MTEGAQVWVVDDDRSVRFVLATALRQAGFRVEEFGNAADARVRVTAQLVGPHSSSGTTSGTSGSIRQAEELSITIAPAAAAFGAYSLEVVLPAENRAMSRPEKSAVFTVKPNCSTLTPYTALSFLVMLPSIMA